MFDIHQNMVSLQRLVVFDRFEELSAKIDRRLKLEWNFSEFWLEDKVSDWSGWIYKAEFTNRCPTVKTTIRHTVDWRHKSTIVLRVTTRIDFTVNNDFILKKKTAEKPPYKTAFFLDFHQK